MATTKPEITKADDLLNFYNLQGDDRARFIVYAGHRVTPENIRFEYLSDDKATGEAELSAICQAIMNSPTNTNLYILQVLADQLPNPRSKKPPANSRSITFQLNSPAAGVPVGGAGGFGSMDAYRLQQVERKLDALAEVDDDDDDDDDQPETVAGPPKPLDVILATVAGLLSQPAVQNAIISGIMSIFSKPQQNNQQQPAGATIAGVPFTVTGQVVADLETIATVVPDVPGVLAKLAEMAKNKPDMLKFLVGQL